MSRERAVEKLHQGYELPEVTMTPGSGAVYDTYRARAFGLKDSGKREAFASGMVRDVQNEKTLYSLAFDGPMFERYAKHLTAGARKYSPRNWMKASGQEELERFRESAIRHFVQWLQGNVEEDHAAAIFFNVNGYEYVKEKL